MENFSTYIIKSFKHDGHLHRTWMENAWVPQLLQHETHQSESMMILINSQTKIVEADGKEWVSRIPGVSFFIPHQWFNVVALLEETGVRYYCNIASPPFLNRNVITYIDYDLDVIVMPSGAVHIVDQDEYEQHKQLYHYSAIVESKVKTGLKELLKRIEQRRAPFHEEWVRFYHQEWEKWRDQGTEA